MKVLFLDIDGVLNCAYTKERIDGRIGLDPAMVVLFNEIVVKTAVSVVLSSAWRRLPNWRLDLQKGGLEPSAVIGQTPSLGGIRGLEIQAWLDQHPEVEKYAILDDGADMLPHQKLFKTAWGVGLTREIADEVIRWFND